MQTTTKVKFEIPNAKPPKWRKAATDKEIIAYEPDQFKDLMEQTAKWMEENMIVFPEIKDDFLGAMEDLYSDFEVYARAKIVEIEDKEEQALYEGECDFQFDCMKNGDPVSGAYIGMQNHYLSATG